MGKKKITIFTEGVIFKNKNRVSCMTESTFSQNKTDYS